MTSPPPHDPETAKAVRYVLIAIIGLSTFLLGVFGGVWVGQKGHALTDLCEPGSSGQSPPQS